MGKPRATMARPHGFLVETLDHGTGKQIWQDTVCCCHCGKHTAWNPKRGGFGWCGQCSDWVCPGKQCIPCRPVEKLIEKPHLYKPFVSAAR